METPEIPRQSLSQIAKNPMAYMLMLCVGLVGFFARAWFDTSGTRATDSNDRYDQCLIDLRTERKMRDELTTKLLIQKGTIDAVVEIADSVQ